MPTSCPNVIITRLNELVFLQRRLNVADAPLPKAMIDEYLVLRAALDRICIQKGLVCGHWPTRRI